MTAIVPYALDGKTFTQAQVQSAACFRIPCGSWWRPHRPASTAWTGADRPGPGLQSGRHAKLGQQSGGSGIDHYILCHRSWPDHSAGSGWSPPSQRTGRSRKFWAIFVGGLYIFGPGFNVGPATGFPADVFTVTAVIPNPTAFSLPGLVPIQIQLGGVASQGGLGSSTVEIAVKPNQ